MIDDLIDGPSQRECIRCHEIKHQDEFYRNNRTGKLHTACKSCLKMATRRVQLKRLENPLELEKVRKSSREAYHSKKNRKHGTCFNCDKPTLNNKVFCETCGTKRAEFQRSPKLRGKVRDRYKRYKDQVYMAYGGYKCACCGETELLFLSIDHINNDGGTHRKQLRPRNPRGFGSGNLYHWLVKNKFPTGFQVLCMNCQFGKSRNGGICPHKDASNGKNMHSL